MSDKKQVTIFVAGEHNSAKTTVIAVIEKALKEAGIEPKLLSNAAYEAENFVGVDIVSQIADKVEISIEELTMPAPVLDNGTAPKGYVAIRHAGGMKVIPRGNSLAE